MFWMIQHLRPKFERTFDIPSVFLECEDFSNDLPQLPLTNVHHAWLELVHVHLKNNVDGGVNEWLLQVLFFWGRAFCGLIFSNFAGPCGCSQFECRSLCVPGQICVEGKSHADFDATRRSESFNCWILLLASLSDDSARGL